MAKRCVAHEMLELMLFMSGFLCLSAFARHTEGKYAVMMVTFRLADDESQCTIGNMADSVLGHQLGWRCACAHRACVLWMLCVHLIKLLSHTLRCLQWNDVIVGVTAQ